MAEEVASMAHIARVGDYHHGWVPPSTCSVCHNAEWGDFIYEGVCGKCLYDHFKNHPKVETDNVLTPKYTKVFANWYVKGCFEEVVKLISDIYISLELCEVDAKDFQGNEDTHWRQGDGYFPEEGVVTTQQISIKEDPAPRWRITMEVEDKMLWAVYGPSRYSFSPNVLNDSWDPHFIKNMRGEAAEWGLK